MVTKQQRKRGILPVNVKLDGDLARRLETLLLKRRLVRETPYTKQDFCVAAIRHALDQAEAR